MCTSPDQIREIVREELDDRDVRLWERINTHMQDSIDAKLVHMKSSPETRMEMQTLRDTLAQHDKDEREHWAKIDEMLAFQKESAEAINAVKDLLAGGRVLRSTAQLLAWIGAICAGIIGFKVWLIDK